MTSWRSLLKRKWTYICRKEPMPNIYLHSVFLNPFKSWQIEIYSIKVHFSTFFFPQIFQISSALYEFPCTMWLLFYFQIQQRTSAFLWLVCFLVFQKYSTHKSTFNFLLGLWRRFYIRSTETFLLSPWGRN